MWCRGFAVVAWIVGYFLGDGKAMSEELGSVNAVVRCPAKNGHSTSKIYQEYKQLEMGFFYKEGMIGPPA